MYVNLQVANSGDDRSKVSRHGWSKSISEGEDRELIARRDKACIAAFYSPEICAKTEKQNPSGEFREENTCPA